MSLYLLSIFVIGPLIVAYFLVKREEEIVRQVETFNSRWPIRLRR